MRSLHLSTTTATSFANTRASPRYTRRQTLHRTLKHVRSVPFPIALSHPPPLRLARAHLHLNGIDFAIAALAITRVNNPRRHVGVVVLPTPYHHFAFDMVFRHAFARSLRIDDVHALRPVAFQPQQIRGVLNLFVMGQELFHV